jgi:hypothetical protein
MIEYKNKSRNKNFIFHESCSYGHISVAQWLYGLGNVNIHARNDIAFQIVCLNGHLSIAQWLYNLSDIDIHVNDFVFKMSCYHVYLSVSKSLYNLDISVSQSTFTCFVMKSNRGYDLLQQQPRLLFKVKYSSSIFTVLMNFLVLITR